MKNPRQLPNLFQSIFETSWQAILIVDHQEIILEANQAACEFFAFAKAELIGKKITKLLPEISYNKEEQKGVRVLKKDGSQTLVNLQTRDVHKNKPSRIVIYIKEIADGSDQEQTQAINKEQLSNADSSYFYWAPETRADMLLKHQGPTFRGISSQPPSTITFVPTKEKTNEGLKSKSTQISNGLESIKKDEFVLKREKEVLYNYMNTASSIFLVINAQHQIEFANWKACEVLKTPHKELIGKDWFESFIPQHSRKQLSTLFNQTINGDIPPLEEYENIVLVKNEERRIQWRNGILKDHRTQLKSVISSGIDITEQTTNREELQDNKDKNAALLYAIPDMMFVQDSKGQFLDFHDPDPEKSEIPPNQIIGKKMKEFFPSNVQELIEQAQLRVYKNKALELVEYSVNDPQKTMYYEARIVPMYGKKLLTIIRDVTLEKTIDKELKESKEQLKVYAQNLEEKVTQRTEALLTTLDQLITSNLKLEEQILETQEAQKRAVASKTLSTSIAKNFPNGFIIVFNSEFEILLKEGEGIRKLKLDKVISEGMSVDELLMFPKSQKEKLKKQILKTIEGKHLHLETKYNKKHFSINTTPLVNEKGIISSALFVYNDISVQKKIALKAQNALKKEQELSELKSRFISMASHEFRTPLGAILSSAVLIEKLNDPEQGDRRLKHVSRIRSSVKNLVVILNDFLSLSKLQEGIVAPELVVFDIIDFIKSVIEEIEVIKKNGQSITLTYQQPTIEVFLDAKLLRHIIFNLLSNSIKYSKENKEISINLFTSDQQLFLEVTDQGIGIPIEDQEHMFGPFFRAHNAVNLEGTGLGLNIVKQYVKLMGGRIKFKSNLNTGSSFCVEFPINNKGYEKDIVN